jgi:hypothetical protein
MADLTREDVIKIARECFPGAEIEEPPNEYIFVRIDSVTDTYIDLFSFPAMSGWLCEGRGLAKTYAGPNGINACYTHEIGMDPNQLHATLVRHKEAIQFALTTLEAKVRLACGFHKP